MLEKCSAVISPWFANKWHALMSRLRASLGCTKKEQLDFRPKLPLIKKPAENDESALDEKLALDLFKSIGGHFRNDINAIWQRSQFFATINVGLMAFFFSKGIQLDVVYAYLALPVVGIVLSLCWVGIVFVTIIWIDVWRRALVGVEEQMVRHGPYRWGEALEGKQFHEYIRPEWFALVIAILFVVGWVVILGLSWTGKYPTPPKPESSSGDRICNPVFTISPSFVGR